MGLRERLMSLFHTNGAERANGAESREREIASLQERLKTASPEEQPALNERLAQLLRERNGQ